MSETQPKGEPKARDKLSSGPLPFEVAVGKVLNAPPTPEQQAKRAARKARAEEKRKKPKRQCEPDTGA